MKVFKYELDIDDWQDIAMPFDAQILTVQVQNGKPCIWARVEETTSTELVRFYMHGTGHEINPDAGDYVGTFQLHSGSLIFHVFLGKTPNIL